MTKIENENLLTNLLELAVANFYAIDEKTGLELYSGSLESHSITAQADSEEIKAGVANDVIATIEKSKTVELKIVDVQSRADLQALKLGGSITTGTVEAMHMPKNYVVGTGKTITLDQTPKSGETVALYNNKTKKMVEASKATLSTNKITITDTSINEGDTVFVTGFKFMTKATDKYARISSDAAMPAMLVVVEVPLFNTDLEVVAKKQYIFPRCKLSTSVTLEGSTEKTKKTEETSIKVMKDASLDYLGTVVWIYPGV